uniref:Ribonuclease H protein At1g65750 family n=1 Tax=Cajanus cajan TaxID=3821 RepID=A0A151T1P1_CAJCA|nr:Putative ribonuclease H protein At1g65750 family [Cajanus cajan]
MLNCRITHLPFLYLGLPIGSNPRKVDTCKLVLLKFNKKLSGWKSKILSMAGRVCLINSVLTNLPLYYLSFFKMPKKVVRKIVTLQRNLLWGAKEGNRKISWVSWRKVCQSKKQGGLGVKDIEMFNDALLGKWRWGLFHQHQSLWSRILNSKYDGWRNLQDGKPNPASSIWWKDINNWFDQGIEWIIGQGEHTRFWLDPWCKFPRLFLNSIQQNNTIASMGAWVDNGWKWDLLWRREWFGREIQNWEELQQLLQMTVPQKEVVPT